MCSLLPTYDARAARVPKSVAGGGTARLRRGGLLRLGALTERLCRLSVTDAAQGHAAYRAGLITGHEPGEIIVESQGSVYSWCGCRDLPTGRRLGARCLRRGQSGHGSWYFSVDLPAGPGWERRRIRRGGFRDRAVARALLGAWLTHMKV